MIIINEEEYQKFHKNNTDDPYSTAVIAYLETWANLMEDKINKGNKLEDIAEKTSFEADIEGITGFMYGCAVNVLSQVWRYGEELRNWHNKKYNYTGNGVVNPAILTIN